jgi:hypothetical protein
MANVNRMVEFLSEGEVVQCNNRLPARGATGRRGF